MKNVPVNDLREMWPHRESIMTPKFQCGATCTKGPDREMLACESTTPRCNLHLEEKLTVGKPARVVCLANTRFSFSSGVSVRDFFFLFIGCVWFLLFLKGKCSIFGLSWTFWKSSLLSLTKTPLISKEQPLFVSRKFSNMIQGFQFLQWKAKCISQVSGASHKNPWNEHQIFKSFVLNS